MPNDQSRLNAILGLSLICLLVLVVGGAVISWLVADTHGETAWRRECSTANGRVVGHQGTLICVTEDGRVLDVY